MRWILFTLALLTGAQAEDTGPPDEALPEIVNPLKYWNVASPKENYSGRDHLFDRIELRPVPAASFINKDKTDYLVPFSTQGKTQDAAGQLRAAWQRFEDRYYWRAMLELNNPAMSLTHCLVSVSQDLKTTTPEAFIATQNGMYPAFLNGKIPERPSRPDLFMDQYGLLPRVPREDFCDDFKTDFSVMYLPGQCFYLGTEKLFCIEGATPTLNPLSPKPINFKMDQAVARVAKATQRAETVYQAQYQGDALKALTPGVGFFPLAWDTLMTGAVIAPVAKLVPDLMGITRVAKEARNNLAGLHKYTAYLYFAQGVTMNQLSGLLALHTLPLRSDVLGRPPGVWQFEEFKRRLPINDPVSYERFGYTSVFQAWNEAKVLLLPEKLEAKPLRQMIYFASGINHIISLDPPGIIPVPVPAPVLIPVYAAGLPYAGVQTNFDWVSVAEGYQVPRVSGVPLLDYRGRTGQ